MQLKVCRQKPRICLFFFERCKSSQRQLLHRCSRVSHDQSEVTRAWWCQVKTLAFDGKKRHREPLAVDLRSISRSLRTSCLVARASPRFENTSQSKFIINAPRICSDGRRVVHLDCCCRRLSFVFSAFGIRELRRASIPECGPANNVQHVPVFLAPIMCTCLTKLVQWFSSNRSGERRCPNVPQSIAEEEKANS